MGMHHVKRLVRARTKTTTILMPSVEIAYQGRASNTRNPMPHGIPPRPWDPPQTRFLTEVVRKGTPQLYGWITKKRPHGRRRIPARSRALPKPSSRPSCPPFPTTCAEAGVPSRRSASCSTASKRGPPRRHIRHDGPHSIRNARWIGSPPAAPAPRANPHGAK